jgi:murein endopeptidase
MCTRLVAAAAAAAALASSGVAAAGAPAPALPPPAGGPSVALGVPWCGHLRNGVPLAPQGADFFTWDMPAHRSPNPQWRRYGTRRLIDVLHGVTSAYRRAHPGGARLGIADLSLPRGGAFGSDYGGLGHLSHQNGLDADVLYPRRDRAEAPPSRPGQIDHAAAQDLVNRFLAAGAQYVFVGVGLGLHGRRGVVQAIPHHLDHMHVRIRGQHAVRSPRSCPWRPM